MHSDFCAFAGRWPFRRLRRGCLGDVLADGAARGITGGLMSSLDAIFYNDPWEADGPLLAALAGTGWRLAMAVDPTLPRSGARLERGARAGAAAVRLYPGIHGYGLDSPCVAELLRAAEDMRLPVLVTVRLEDPRLEYLLRQRPVETALLPELAARYPRTALVASNCPGALLPAAGAENLWADTAGLGQELFPFEGLPFAAERLLFGSCAPLQCLDSALLNLPPERRETILARNAEAFWRAIYG